MSHRPSHRKKIKRLRKMMRVTLPTHFDLVDYLKLHRHAQTTGEANRLILGGKVRNGSHTIGIEKVMVGEDANGVPQFEEVVKRVQPAKYKNGLIVL